MYKFWHRLKVIHFAVIDVRLIHIPGKDVFRNKIVSFPVALVIPKQFLKFRVAKRSEERRVGKECER